MVFSFFTRKTSPTRVPVPIESPPTTVATASKEPQIPQPVPLQLRTPSPSIDSASAAPGTVTTESTSPAPTRPEQTHEVLPTPVLPSLEPTPESLTQRVSSIPAKTLHAFVLSRLAETPHDTLKGLAGFFESLTPPPRLHCVRCHKDYVEVENDDRSCLVPHDDESAEVERVGRNGEHRRTKEGTVYETLWGCCGKITEGDGSEGPPDGWCYEGKHTTDIKRARFRADSSPHDDKLTSCLRLNCHGIRSQLPRPTSTRKRARATGNYKEASSGEDDSEGDPDSGIDEIVGKEKQKRVKKMKSKAKIAEDDAMDVDGASATAEEKNATQENTPVPSSPPAAPSVAPKRRGRLPKAKAAAEETNKESTSVPKSTGKRRRHPPKSKPFVQDSDSEAARGRRSTVSPTRPRTRSTSRAGRPMSRSRQSTMFVSLESPQRMKLRAIAAEKSDVDMDVDNEKPKKKRKIVA